MHASVAFRSKAALYPCPIGLGSTLWILHSSHHVHSATPIWLLLRCIQSTPRLFSSLLAGCTSDRRELLRSFAQRFFSHSPNSGNTVYATVTAHINIPQVVHGVGCQDTCPRGLLTLEQVIIILDEIPLLIFFVQAVIALKRRIDAASAEFGSNIAVRAVEWHSRVHRVHGWEREISRVSLPTIPDLRHSIKDVLGDCFLLLSHRWHDVLLAEVRQFQDNVHSTSTFSQVAFLLNDAYGSFASRFPAFTGSVSIVAHSLGCSIVWELLSATDSSSPSRMRWPLQFRSCSCL